MPADEFKISWDCHQGHHGDGFCRGLQNGTGMNVKPQASLAPFLIILKNNLPVI